jgi:hypothetical protein
MTLPKSANFEKFEKAWATLDEDTKEIIAGGLYVLGREDWQVRQSHHLTTYTLNEQKKRLLKKLVEYTEEF